MRIVHIETGRNWLGGPAQVLYLMKGLRDRGHASCLICPPDSALGKRAADAGLDVRFTPFSGDVDPRLFGGAVRAIRSMEAEIVHLHSRRGADTQGALAARYCGVPVLLSRRVDYPLRGNPMVRWRYARLYDHIVAISEGIRQVVIAGGVAPERVSTVHSAVDTDQFRPDPRRRTGARAGLGIPEGTPFFAIVAHMIPRKGHATLLRAVARVAPERRPFLVAAFGKGAEEPRLREMARGLSIEDRVLWPGFRDNLHELLPGIDCLVHPARMEGLGVAILQALACAKPVIACPVGGIPEAVRPPEDGWLVPVDDDEALADAMREVLDDPDGAAAKGCAGRALMEREFSVDAMVDGNVAVYERILAARRG